MAHGRKIAYLVVAILASALSLFGQSKRSTVKEEVVVYYRHDKYSIDRTYMTNGETFATLDSIMLNYGHAIDSVAIISYASPEGRHYYNMWLSRQRANSMKGFLHVKYPDVDFSNLTTHPKGEDFEGLVQMVEADKKVPYRSEVLKVLKQKDVHVDTRMEQLYKLRGGVSYSYIKRQILPWLRTATTCIIYYDVNAIEAQEVIDRIAQQEIIIEEREDGKASAFVPYVPEPEHPAPAGDKKPEDKAKEDGVGEEQPTEQPAEQPAEEQPTEGDESEDGASEGTTEGDCRSPYYSLRTNALYDLALIPNIGFEFYLGGNFSIGANWHYSWFKSDRAKWYWRTYGGDLNARYWFGKAAHNKPLTGHHIGLYGQIVTYDFLAGSKNGILAERWSWDAGVEYGYALPLAKRLNLDFTLGVGYHTGQFYEYMVIDDCYVWQATKNRQYIGPTKFEVSLVWLLGCSNTNAEKGGDR